MKKRKILSFLVGIGILLSMLSAGAFAAEDYLVDQTGSMDESRISAPTAALSENYVVNGSFEDGLEGWEIDGEPNNVCLVTDLLASDGEKALMVSGNEGYLEKAVYQYITLPERGIYTLSMDAALFKEGQASVFYAILRTALGGTMLSAEAGPVIENRLDWQTVSMEIEVPSDGLQLGIAICSEYYASTFLVDNVRLERTGEVAPPAGNLLTNGGFESGLGNWNSVGSPFVNPTSGQAHSGSQSIAFGYFTSEGLNRYVEQAYATDFKGAYKCAAYIKTDTNLTGVGAALFIEARDASGAVLASTNSAAVANSNGDWQLIETTVNAPTGTKSIVIKIGGLYCTGAFYVDDVSLTYMD